MTQFWLTNVNRSQWVELLGKLQLYWQKGTDSFVSHLLLGKQMWCQQQQQPSCNHETSLIAKAEALRMVEWKDTASLDPWQLGRGTDACNCLTSDILSHEKNKASVVLLLAAKRSETDTTTLLVNSRKGKLTSGAARGLPGQMPDTRSNTANDSTVLQEALQLRVLSCSLAFGAKEI